MQKEMIPQLLPDGRIDSPSFHDGHLKGISLKDTTVRIFLAALDGANYEIEIGGVKRLRATEFLQGNIVLSARLTWGADCDEARLSWLHGIEQRESKSERWFVTLLADVREKPLLLFDLMPSYGCELAALGETCTIYRQ